MSLYLKNCIRQAFIFIIEFSCRRCVTSNIAVLGVMRSEGVTQAQALKRARDPVFFHRLSGPLSPKPKQHRPELVDAEINKCISSMLKQAEAKCGPTDVRREKCHLYLKLSDAQSDPQPNDVSVTKEERIRFGRLLLCYFEIMYCQENYTRYYQSCQDFSRSCVYRSRYHQATSLWASSVHSSISMVKPPTSCPVFDENCTSSTRKQGESARQALVQGASSFDGGIPFVARTNCSCSAQVNRDFLFYTVKIAGAAAAIAPAATQ